MELLSDDILTLDIIESGCVTWEDLVRSVRNFKYGRGESRGDFEQVWYRRIGTCSTKHGFLYQVAQKNGFKQVQLIVGIYLMTKENTPKVGAVLDKHQLSGIPEAHCYLRINEEYLDATSNQSDYLKIASNVMEERSILPEFLVSDKIKYHREFMENWITKEGSSVSIDELWQIREECIEALSNT